MTANDDARRGLAEVAAEAGLDRILDLVTFVAATGDGPARVIDITVGSYDLAEGDPRRPGDIIVHDASLDREAFAAVLEAAAHFLRGAEAEGREP